MATAWPSSAGSRAWDSNLQGVDVPMPVALAKKEPGKGNQYPEDTKIRNRTGEGRGGCKRERVLNNTTPTTQDRQGGGYHCLAMVTALPLLSNGNALTIA